MINRPVILFDGYCNLCSWSVQFVVSHDKKKIFDFIPLFSEEGKELLNKFDLDPSQFDSIVLITESGAYVKSEAILEIVKNLGGIWKIGSIFKVVPRGLLDRLYDVVAKYRYSIFGKRKECFIPKSYFNKSQS
jgi:predicted DCC family thiol-disulfide oxidoreductase YuxK